MDRFETFVITIYISIIASGWINNREVMQGLEKNYIYIYIYMHAQ